MRKLVCALALGLCAAPAAADEGWREFLPVGRGYDSTYLYVVTSEHGRLNRLPSRHEGYFFQGGTVEARGGRALYDYDRDYPYDYPSYTVAAAEEEVEDFREPSCTVQRVRDGKSGWADVRVCRN